MKRHILLTAIIFLSGPVSHGRVLKPVNAILGDDGFICAHGRVPTENDSETERIRTHLQRVIHLLRAFAPAGLDAEKSARRANLIDALEDYVAAGEFPRNTVFPGRRPVFIDPEGRLCAVGYLVAKSSGREAAEKIAALHRYDYLLEMNEPLVNSWAEENGFTLRELASIQPTYSDSDLIAYIIPKNDITSGLIAYYPFNANSLDESGNSRHLEVFNSEIKSNGPFGGYLDQTQPNAYSKNPVTGLNAEDLKSSSFTISLWINPKALDRASEWVYLIENVGGGGIRIGSNGTMSKIIDLVQYYDTIQIVRSPQITEFKENEWQQIVVTHDNGKSVFYLNGKEVFNATTNAVNMNFNNFRIGNYAGIYGFNGGLDEIRIYNRALSPEDVAFLCDKESGKSEMVFVKRGTLPQGSELAGQEVASFLVSRFETTWSEWKKVREWAASNGYDIGEVGQGISNSHPVVDVNWYEAVKWCNAKSQMEGLVPFYTFNTQVFKAGEGIPSINPAANGYRLLNEAEWEWVARGATQSIGYVFSGSNDINRVGWYNNNSGLKVNPVAGMAPNEIGIFDMTGNVWEWCWDLYDPQSSTGGSFANPRRIRGGSWGSNVGDCAVAYRGNPGNPGGRDGSIGFRYARNFEQPIFSETAGTYIGNFGAADLDEPAEALLRNGQVLITLQANRQFTGALVFNGQKVGFRGRFDADGNWSGTVSVASRLVEMELFLEAGEVGNRVSCIVVFNGEESTAFVLLPAAHTGAKGDFFGWNGSRLNVLFQSSGISGKKFGYGFASAASGKDGVMRFAGRLGDDTTWSGAARVVRDETGGLRLPLAVPLNSTKGLLHGEGTLDPSADVQSGEAEFFSVGAWTWVRGANARARAHKTGFVEGLQPIGQRWNYQRGKNLWTGAVNQMPVLMSWDAGLAVLPAARTFSTVWPLNNRPVWSPVPPRGFQMTVSVARGEFSGKIPTGLAVVPFRGLFISPGVASDGGKILGGGFITGQESSGVLEFLDAP